jgi:TrmH family RNA methyltransferase
MLTHAQEKLLHALTTKKGRREEGRFLIEGEKFVHDAREYVDFVFTPSDTDRFDTFVSTETPQRIAAVARIPRWTHDDIASRSTIVVLDGVQDPGNVGTILRACLGFGASLILIESAEVTNPKTVRASASAILCVPWMVVSRARAVEEILSFHRTVMRLELRDGAMNLGHISRDPAVLIAGNEGSGITLPIQGISVFIPIDVKLESLNVGIATSIALYERSRNI